ncbi:MAG TPA: TIGR03960 family B12-binding radical SAM protein [Nitrospirota bacterium]|nr:TIGR03960 family B12-binding radical SAM protein [Nitrospirota bacterium]
MSRKLREKNDALLAAERGTVYKARGAEVAVALAYPNVYHVGMSNLGMHQIYSILNSRADTVCERVFLPEAQDIEVYVETGTRLFSMESKRQVKGFDILAFSVSFEQDYLNILEMLRLSNIPQKKEERSADDPLVILGGICSFFNPEPLADFIDCILIGEGEEIAGEFIDIYKANRSQGRQRLLRAVCGIPGAYVPEFYRVLYEEDGTIKERKILDQSAPEHIVKRSARDFNRTPASTVIFTPQTEFSNMHLAEITRGCGRHCRFCMAGYIYLPPRNLSIDQAQAQAKKADDLCSRIGLVGAAISDFPDIGQLCSAIAGDLSVSSLRADSISEALIDRLAKSGHKTISVAPEAGSERLRNVINKGITEDDLLRAADLIFGGGIPNLKLYFILGLPTETKEDVDAIVALAEKMRAVQLKHARPKGRIGRITLSVNSFVPKPFTPFQWEPMEAIESLNRKQRILEKAIRKIGNMNIIHDLPKWEYIQALLSRGDRRIGALIAHAHAQGGDWRKAAKEIDMTMDFYVARKREFNEVLPWDFIDIGLRKEYLRKEHERALEGKLTPRCRVGSCTTCGVCRPEATRSAAD